MARSYVKYNEEMAAARTTTTQMEKAKIVAINDDEINKYQKQWRK